MRKSLPFCLGFIWLMTVTSGLAILAVYQTTPGPRVKAPARWPGESALSFPQKRPALLMFAHPRCPCTRSSLRELAVLMADCQNQVDATVLFFQPASSNADWSHTDLWRSAAEIPGVSVRPDVDGREAKLFQAGTSGTVLLFNTAGQLVFNGGITASRGHEGDNDGRAALTAILLHDNIIGTETPVFGCSFSDSRESCPAAHHNRSQ